LCQRKQSGSWLVLSGLEQTGAAPRFRILRGSYKSTISLTTGKLSEDWNHVRHMKP